MSYSQALEQQLALMEWHSTYRRHNRSQFNDEGGNAFWDTVQDALPDWLRRAETFYWSPELCAVVAATGAALPEYSLRAEDFLTPYGYCWFPAAIPLPAPAALAGRADLTGFAWATFEGGTPLLWMNVTRTYKRTLRECGISETVRFHDLRHTHATALLKSKLVTVAAVSGVLGHYSPAVTHGIYDHGGGDADDQYREALAQVFGGG